jgi:outer membrane protein assembly factor BamE (lipoprotein component of BamABCDE complex)
MKKFIFIIIPLLLTVNIMVACTPMKATRGNLLEDYELKEVLPGIDGKDEVIQKIGSPTTISPFNENIWYYMGQKTKKKGILDPKVTEERVVVVSFNQTDGKVDSVKDRQGGREDIPLVQRATPVSGNEFTFMQQMLGNVGKFNRPEGSAVDTAGGNR